MLSNATEVADQTRQLSLQIALQPIIGFNPISNLSVYQQTHNLQFSGLASKLPDNIHLLSLENRGPVQGNQILARFENYYQPNDQSKLSVESKVSLNVLAGVKIDKVERTNLVLGAMN